VNLLQTKNTLCRPIGSVADLGPEFQLLVEVI